MSVTLRSQVLRLYSRIFRVARQWEAQDPNETKVERNYIVDEARALFRENKGLVQDDEIRMRMMEAEARLAMAEHYRNPYPRPVNLPKTSYAKQVGVRPGHHSDPQDGPFPDHPLPSSPSPTQPPPARGH